jgi:high-affinity nickel-transport protein
MGGSLSLKQRVVLMYIPLIAANVGLWIWALVAFHDHPVLLGTCALAYVLGLRHAVDPDHIAAIDNVTRKLMQEGRQPISVGLWFALGHSALICLAVAAIAFTATSLSDERFANWREIGGVISTVCSALFLFTIAVFNMVVLVAWLVPVAVAMWLYKTQGVFASYLPLPCAIACGLLYIVLSKVATRDAIAVRA